MSEQQHLLSIHFDKVKNLRDLTLDFENTEVVGIFGPNGCGKSTILHCLACVYKPKSNGGDYKFSHYFKSDEYTNWVGSKLSIRTRIREGQEVRPVVREYIKRPQRWMKDYSVRPDRDVFFIDIKSSVPDIEIEDKKKATIKTRRSAVAIPHSQDVLRDACFIMSFNYNDYYNSEGNKKKYITVKNSTGLQYKSLSMGTGEQRLFRILQTLHDAPKYSLILIDEIDLTLHTAALDKLLDKIVSIAHNKHLQVVFTSHREEILQREDIEFRHIFQTPQSTLCLTDTTPECIDRMSGHITKPLDIYVEDKISSLIILKFLTSKGLSDRANILRFGALSNAFTVASGLLMTDKLNDNVAIITDGDKHRDHDAKIKQLEKYFSGTEVDVVEKRETACSRILQYSVDRDNLPPELYIWQTLCNSQSDSKVIQAAKSIIYVDDTHHYVTDLANSLGMGFELGCYQIIEEFSKESDSWHRYLTEIESWLDTRITQLGLYRMKSIKLCNLELIGGGGNTLVYRPIEGRTDCDGYVIKVPRFNLQRVKTSVEIWHKLQACCVPTLSIVDECLVDGKEAVLCEDLFSHGKIYVSPNSVETDEQKQLRLINESLYQDSPKSHTVNQQEQALYKEKITGISNIPEFLESIKITLKHAADSKLYLDFDCYFYGFNPTAGDVVLDFKIADFDNIYQDIEDPDLYDKMVAMFLESFKKFIDLFVVEDKQNDMNAAVDTFIWV